MDGQSIIRVETENNLGIDALKKGRRDEASTYFFSSLAGTSVHYPS
ncbi:MAG: hypothetical protein HWN68_19045 [Desulfobacterales bacterium]|nr:hypothetical protein [Desulfobacterales bacterium]